MVDHWMNSEFGDRDRAISLPKYVAGCEAILVFLNFGTCEGLAG